MIIIALAVAPATNMQLRGFRFRVHHTLFIDNTHSAPLSTRCYSLFFFLFSLSLNPHSDLCLCPILHDRSKTYQLPISGPGRLRQLKLTWAQTVKLGTQSTGFFVLYRWRYRRSRITNGSEPFRALENYSVCIFYDLYEWLFRISRLTRNVLFALLLGKSNLGAVIDNIPEYGKA